MFTNLKIWALFFCALAYRPQIKLRLAGVSYSRRGFEEKPVCAELHGLWTSLRSVH